LTPNEMLKRAKDCRVRAEAARDPHAKATLLKAAAAWDSVARQNRSLNERAVPVRPAKNATPKR
jgi:hypothetical protein